MTGSGTGPSTSASRGQFDARRGNPATASAVPDTAAIRDTGGNPSSARSASSRTACPTGIPPHQRLHGPQGRLGDHDDRAARPLRPAPAPRRRSTAAARPPRPADRAGRAWPSRRAAGQPRTRPRRPARPPACSRPARASPARCPAHVPARRSAPARRERPAPVPPRSAARPRPAPAAGSPRTRGSASRPPRARTSRTAAAPAPSRASNGPAQCRHRAGARHRAQAIRGT